VNHVIYAFNKQTEALMFEVHIPAGHIEQLRTIMSWTDEEDEIYGYDLDAGQINELESMIGRSFFDPQCDFQLSSYSGY
jgi:hypothetical protein